MATNPVYQLYLLSDEELEKILDNPQPGIYVTPARTGKGWFHHAVTKSSGLLFPRENQWNVVMIAIGDQYCDILDDHKHVGLFVRTHYGANSRHRRGV